MTTTGDNHEPIIEFRGVTKRFGKLVVLDEVDLRIYPHQTTVIIGESGIGKSVTLKHTLGLLRPDHGEVLFEGQRIDLLDERELVDIRRNFGFLFQMGALFDSMTAAENVGFPMLEQTDYTPEQLREQVAHKLRLVGLEGMEQRKPAELSGGQRKRVALARAIALNPKVILYDEPTTGLDPIRASDINRLINKLKQELGVTSVVVTHDMASAFKIGDRILMLHQGGFRIDGPPQEIRGSTDPVVRRFVEGWSSDDQPPTGDGAGS